MASIFMSRAFRLSKAAAAIPNRCYHVTRVAQAGQAWRLQNGMSRSGNEYGPLTDKPDWSYVDGRSRDLTKNQMKRQLKQVLFSKRIERLLAEMDSVKTMEDGSEVEDGDEVEEELNRMVDGEHVETGPSSDR